MFKVRAVNSLGNKDATPATLTWSVLTPAQGVKNLEAQVKSMHLNSGIQNALITQLNAALQFLDHEPMIKTGACIEINDFIQQVQRLAGLGEITPANALQLMDSAQAILSALGC